MAIADDIALYALGYWSHESRPFRIDSVCLNAKQRKNPCTACSDACPQDLQLHGTKVNWLGCINCNLCVTACPTAAINQGAASFDHIRQLALDTDASVSFACENAPDEPCDERCLCLAVLPWDLVAACALSGGVVIKATPCKTCPHEHYVAQVKQLIRDVRAFLGEDTFARAVSLHDSPDKVRTAGADKRMAFDRMAHNVASGTENLLAQKAKPTMSCYRALLLDAINRAQDAGEPVQVSWKTLEENGTCRACEICTKLCPHQALELVVPGYTDKEGQTQDGEDKATLAGSGTAVHADAWPQDAQVLVHNASKCTQCGLCYMTCPTEGLTGWNTLTTSNNPAYTYFPITVELCEKCGHPFVPEEGETRCKACRRPQFGYAKK